MEQASVPIPGPLTDRIRDLAVETGLWLVPGSLFDPEGIVRQQAGSGEEILVDVPDLATVTRVRRHGSAGVNRPWINWPATENR
ncbi:hypothetical protein [Streptomyces atratus]|uniref:hypothetical protein n=1 Tax=Streptomyces atratus TaxID=1893 RepID=UPI0033D04CD0